MPRAVHLLSGFKPTATTGSASGQPEATCTFCRPQALVRAGANLPRVARLGLYNERCGWPSKSVAARKHKDMKTIKQHTKLEHGGETTEMLSVKEMIEICNESWLDRFKLRKGKIVNMSEGGAEVSKSNLARRAFIPLSREPSESAAHLALLSVDPAERAEAVEEAVYTQLDCALDEEDNAIWVAAFFEPISNGEYPELESYYVRGLALLADDYQEAKVCLLSVMHRASSAKKDLVAEFGEETVRKYQAELL